MVDLINCLIVGAGGFIGCILRYLISLIKINEYESFPYKTLFINVLGSFFIGLIVALALKYSVNDSRLVLFLKVGICGGFTTFSTFALESFDLISTGKVWISIIYIILSVVLSVLAVLLSQIIVR